MISSKHDKPVTPDAIFQCDNDSKGIVAEIKTSLTENDSDLLDEITGPIEQYSNITKGWKTENKTIPEYSILMIVNMLDSKRAQNKIESSIEDGSFKPKKIICLAEWTSHIASHKQNVGDIMLVRHVYGSTGCDYFDKKLKSDIKLNEDELQDEFESKKFIRKKPSRIYVMDIIYNFIFSSLAKEREEFSVTISEILKEIQTYFVSWSGIDSENDQLKPSWINQAMQDFCEIGIAESFSGNSNRYTIKWGYRYKKNIGKYMLEKLCGKLKEKPTKKPQSRLTDFKSI